MNMLLEAGDRKGAAIALDNIGSIHSFLGEYEKALDCYTRSLRTKEEIGDRWGETASLNNIGYVHGVRGDFTEALVQYKKSLKVKMEIGDRWGEAVALNNMGYVYGILGDYSGAHECYSRSIRISETTGNRIARAIALNALARFNIIQQKTAEAKDLLSEAYSILKETGNKEYLRRVTVSLAELELAEYLRLGKEHPDAGKHLKSAKEHAGKAEVLADELSSRSAKAESMLVLARISAAEGVEQDLDSKFEEVISICRDLNRKFEQASACYYLSEWLRSRGADQRAEDCRREAKNLFEQVGAKGWLDMIGGK
jgi:tetratricopeptide (TPR) repeat protein